MNNKIIAIIVAAVIVVAGVGVFLTMNHGTADKEINIVARVNTEGSGIYLDGDEKASDYLIVMTPAEYETYKVTMPATDRALENDDQVIVFHTGAWEKKIFGTPGTTTIQHMQFKEIVEDVMGMNFTLYRDGQALESGNVYYDAGVFNYSIFSTKAYLTGAFIWQAQYSIALANGCVGLVMTDVLFPHHTCCVVAGTHAYMSAHDDVTKAFLEAYIDSVNAVNAILAVGSGTEYEELVDLTVKKLGLENNETNRGIVMEALDTINYTYYDGTVANPLKDLRAAIADLAEKYEMPDSGSGVQVTLKQLGFDNGAEFADKYVDDDYISDILDGDVDPLTASATVKVAVISGDIHQIAIHYGIEKKIFEDNNVTIVLSSQNNGPGVATALENGGANFGLVGAPPLTIKVMNGKLVTA